MISGIVSGATHLSNVEFEGLVRRARVEFSIGGYGEGDTVALLLQNDIAFLVAMTALGRSGIYAATLNWHSHPDEIAYILKDCRARAVLVQDDSLSRFSEAIPKGITIYAVGSDLQSLSTRPDLPTLSRAILDWNERVAARPDTESDARKSRGVIVYTSGTTGRPKGVLRQPFADAAADANQAGQLAAVFGGRPDMRTIICGPLYHGGPSAYARLAIRNLGTGGLIVLHQKFDAEALLRDVEKFCIGHLWLVPTMFHRMLSLPDAVRGAYDMSSLEWIIHGAAPCPAPIKQGMLRWLGPVVREFYGTTETGPATLAPPDAASAKPGTVGKPLPGVTVTIRDERGEPLPAGTVGEICCSNSYYPDFTYINRPEDRRALDIAGEIKTGDLGELDGDGYLFIRDRMKDMVIVGGVNIYPAEIEAVLLTMPGVYDCAAFGIPDEEYGEILAAAVVPVCGAAIDEQMVKQFLGQRQASYKTPRKVFVVPEIPREDSGKVFKRRLREQLIGPAIQ
jgi:long-chain acyl-CoA synthetase